MATRHKLGMYRSSWHFPRLISGGLGLVRCSRRTCAAWRPTTCTATLSSRCFPCLAGRELRFCVSEVDSWLGRMEEADAADTARGECTGERRAAPHGDRHLWSRDCE